MKRRLYRSPTERVISGVAGGVADYLDADPSIVRVIWALLGIITGGVFLVIYIVMWIVVPFPPEASAMATGVPMAHGEDPAAPGSAASSTWNPRPVRRSPHRSGGGSWLVGLILVGLGLYFLAREYLTWFDVDRLWPLVLVALGAVLILVAVRRRPG